MRIARLDLFGFKSFVDRTSIYFGQGISCVVGPNGSGKSNVVDALKWCLGEQSARSLRGSEMSDVIFAGSEDRRPVGFAEVQLTLRTERDEEPFPGDYAAMAEVQVGRRLHRTGASEYLINQNRVRRKDVVELLMDSGIGNNLYSFIEQGEIDKVITASPLERRRVIDEAAGIGRYKARRAEALVRLEATSTQLDRASDVVEEMHRRLVGLEEQVLRAAEYRRLATRIRHAELLLTLAKTFGLKAERRALREEDHDLRAALEEAEAKLVAQSRDMDERRTQAELVETNAGQLRDQLAELDARIREQEATRRLHEERREELVAQVAQAHDDVALAKNDATVAADEVTALEAEAQAVDGRLATVGTEVEARQATVERAHSQAEAARAAATQAEAELTALTESRQQLETTRASLVARREALVDRMARLDEARTTLREEHTTALRLRDEAKERLSPHQGDRDDAAATVRAAQDQYDAALEDQASAERALADAQQAQQARFDAHQAEVRDVQERGRRWVAAAEVHERQRIQQLEEGWRVRLVEAERASADARAAHVASVRKRFEDEAHHVVEQAEARTAAAKSARDLAVEAMDDARSEIDAIDGQIRTARAELAEEEARLVAIQARLAADSGLDEPPLIERIPEGSKSAVLNRLGDRALAPFVTEPQRVLEAAAGRQGDDRLVLWFRPQGDLPPSATGRWETDLSQALRSDGPIAGPGFRIDVEGFVRLGPPEDLGALADEAGRLTKACRGLRDVLEQLEVDRDVAEATWTDASVTRNTAERSWKHAQDEEGRARSTVRAQVAEAEREASEKVRASAGTQGRERTLERDRAIALARDQSEARLASMRTQAERIEAALLDRPVIEDDAGFEPLQQALASARERVRARLMERDAAQQAALERSRGWERAEAEFNAAERDVVRVSGELAKRDTESRELEAEHTRLREEEAQADKAWEQRSAEVADRLRQVEERRVAVAHAVEAESTARAAVGESEDVRTEIRTAQAALLARLEAARGQLERAAQTIERAEERSRTAAMAIEAAKTARDEASKQVDEASEQRGAAFDAYETARARLRTERAALSEIEEHQRSSMAQVKRLGQRAEAIAERVRAASTELEVIHQRMADRYQIDVNELLQQLFVDRELELGVPDDVRDGVTIGERRIEPVEPIFIEPEDLEDEPRIVARVRDLERLRSRLAGFGAVNVAALQEYRELKHRYDEMEAQRLDLEESVRSIQAAITKLNQECRERFRDAFTAVNEHFQVAYPRLVGGGQARLALTDEADLLECGVDIFVQPPGKRLQNLQLLSGGEKAMTAIALLIALFRVKPSPFCVLDEVDAPLDEANGARFNEMLREMASQSQFLVVTHNRKTMECADTLFGVTMAKPGVSRLVSVQL
ncbi:MAG: AAA family ATPase [Myxococcota bacterium]